MPDWLSLYHLTSYSYGTYKVSNDIVCARARVCVTVCHSSALEIKARVVRVEQKIKWWNILHHRHAQAHPEHYLYSG